jgi:hypothetical protein
MSMIRRDGSKPLELAAMKKALEDKRFWCGLGKVVKRDGDDSHFEIEADDSGNPVDVLVEVDLMPEQTPLLCRLGAGTGSLGAGCWKIPAPGTEVAVMIPTGDIEADAMIVAVLSSNAVPSALDGDTFVLVQPKNLIIASQDAGSKVKLGAPDGSTGLADVHRKGDHGDAGTLSITVSGTGVAAVTAVYTDPDGGVHNLASSVGDGGVVTAVGGATNATIKLSTKATEGAAAVQAK